VETHKKKEQEKGKELDAGAGQHTEPLLASSVPNLQLDALALKFNRADLEVDAARENG
jgi:hypothetical protein